MNPSHKKRLASAFANQKERCRNPKNKGFHCYGGKGLDVEYSFEELLSWFSFQTNVPEDFVIGRIDHNKGYALDNIRLETKHESVMEKVQRVPNPGKLRAKKVRIISKALHRTVAIAESTRDAAKKCGVNQIVVFGSCNGSKTRDPDFDFEYLDDPRPKKPLKKVAKRVAIYNKDFTDLIAEADSAEDAAQMCEMTGKAVYDQCRGLTKPLQSKFGFRYLEVKNEFT